MVRIFNSIRQRIPICERTISDIYSREIEAPHIPHCGYLHLLILEYSNLFKRGAMMEKSAELLKALAHPIRLRIVAELLKGTKCVNEIQEILPATQVNISQHLSLLRHAGIVSFARNGSQRCYYVSRPRLVSTILDLLKKGEPFINKTNDDIKREKRLQVRRK